MHCHISIKCASVGAPVRYSAFKVHYATVACAFTVYLAIVVACRHIAPGDEREGATRATAIVLLVVAPCVALYNNTCSTAINLLVIVIGKITPPRLCVTHLCSLGLQRGGNLCNGGSVEVGGGEGYWYIDIGAILRIAAL